jgi:hypothetical protein
MSADRSPSGDAVAPVAGRLGDDGTTERAQADPPPQSASAGSPSDSDSDSGAGRPAESGPDDTVAALDAVEAGADAVTAPVPSAAGAPGDDSVETPTIATGDDPPGGPSVIWDDDGLGDRIRPYALTGGRTRSADDLPLETLVVRTAAGSAALPVTAMERRKILDLCERPLSIAEISAYVGVHLGVARVLVGDMKGEGLLDVHRLRATGDRPDIKLLERVLDGLQAL